MTLRRAAVAVVVTILIGALGLGACGDGTPPFCTPLADSADLSGLTDALDAGDLDRAASEAQRLRDLADEAPSDIRADFTELAQTVVDIVDLLAEDLAASAPTTADGAATTVDPGEVERRRDDLNDRLGDLDRRSDRISAWASEECGIDLSATT
ncbi:MAG: hypothetical protein ACYC2O_02865 [Microthrixaceae bacterium]